MKIMMDFLNSFRSLIKVEKVHTDNNVFKLHYRFTVVMLLFFSILVTSKQYFGEPIICDVENNRNKVIDTYCWIHGTFIWQETIKNDILPGLGPFGEPVHSRTSKEAAGYTKHFQRYYQWVCIILCFQALMFYIPRFLWKTWEGGRLRMLVKDLGGPLVSPHWSKENKDKLINYMLCGKYFHNVYALRFVLCEMLNFVNVICQIILMDWFLSGKFSTVQIAIDAFKGENPMSHVFPKITKCTYYKYGPSGSQESRDALCVLPLNIVNEKLFIFLWFWFYSLAILSFLALIYRVFVLIFPRLRVYLLMAQVRYISRKNVETIVKKLSYGDYFVLYQLGKNLNAVVYKELISSLAKSIPHKASLHNSEVTIAMS